jgi:hypothetical protein
MIFSFLYVLFFGYDIDDIQSYMSGFELYANNEVVFDGKTKYLFVWHLFLYLLAKYIFNPFIIIFILRFCIVFFTLNIVYKKSKSFVVIFLVIFSTLFMEHIVGGLRQGVAMIFFLWAFIQNSKKKKYAIYLLALLTHPISFVWIINDVIASLIVRYKFDNIASYLILFFGIIFSIGILFTSSNILGFLGYDNMYDFGITDRSLLSLLLWTVITILLASDKRHNILNIFITITLIQFCCLYMIFDMSFRIIWSIIPLMMVYYMTTIRNFYSKLGLTFFILFTLVHYNYYINKLL